MGPRAGLDRCRRSRPPPGFDPRTFQPVASRYTDYAIPAAVVMCVDDLFPRCLFKHSEQDGRSQSMPLKEDVCSC